MPAEKGTFIPDMGLGHLFVSGSLTLSIPIQKIYRMHRNFELTQDLEG